MQKIKDIILDKLGHLYRSGAFHIIGGNFATKFVTFFGSIVIVRLLSKHDYGILGYVENLYSIAYIFAGLGMSNAILRFVVLGKDIDEKYSYYCYMKRRAMVSNIIIIGLFICIAFLYPHPSKFTGASILLTIYMLQLPFQYRFDNDLMLERAMFENKKYAYMAFGAVLITVIAKCLGAIIDGVLGAIVVVAASYMIMSACTAYKQKIRFKNATAFDIEIGKKKEIDIYSFQYMITNGMWSLFMLTDVFLMGKLSGNPAALADYKVAYVWPGNIGVVVSAIAIFITPYFIQHENDHAWVRHGFKKLILVNVAIVGSMAVLMIIFARPLIFIYAGDEYMNTVSLMRILVVPAFINNALRATVANILAAMGQVKYNMVISMCGIIMEVIIDIIMIPRYGGFGIAIAGIINYSMMFIAVFAVFSKKYELFSSK